MIRYINFCLNLQEAVAIGFEIEMERFGQPECYFQSLAQELLPKRDYMAKFLRDIGMVPTIPEGGYFMLANWSALEKKVKLHEETDENKDYRFTKWMTKNVGLQGIPPSAFYSPEHKHLAEDYVRYCFIKVNIIMKPSDSHLIIILLNTSELLRANRKTKI
jgi:kynurenine--oxoglutarate transaminase/cysteine-S-conjugate beta-lyase/glutamine--phenylpyruvate transaminase